MTGIRNNFLAGGILLLFCLFCTAASGEGWGTLVTFVNLDELVFEKPHSTLWNAGGTSPKVPVPLVYRPPSFPVIHIVRA